MTKLYNDHSSYSNFFIILILHHPVTLLILCAFMLWLIVLLISERGYWLVCGGMWVWGVWVCVWVCVGYGCVRGGCV